MKKTVELTQFERVGDVVNLAWETGGRSYTRTVTASKLSTPEALAAWILAQPEEAPGEISVPTGTYTITVDDATGAVTVARDPQVDTALAVIDQRQAQITADLAALPAATTAEVKGIIGRELQSENKILGALGGILRLLRRLA